MKKLFLILAFVFIGCTADKTEETQQEQKCYTIVAKGYDSRGNYIIIKYENFTNKRYLVNDYLDYLNQTTICEPINLTEQSL